MAERAHPEDPAYQGTAYERALKLKNAAPMDFTGKPMRGFLYVMPEGVSAQRGVDAWVRRGVDFVSTLPKR